MKKTYLTLIILIVFVTPLLGDFNPIEYDPRLPINDSRSKLSFDKIKNRQWILERIKDSNEYIKKHPKDLEAHMVRLYLIQLLTFYARKKAYKLRYLEIGIRYIKESLKIFPNNNELKLGLLSLLSQTFLFKGRAYFLNKARLILSPLKKIIKKNPRCCKGYAAFFLGRFYFKLPPFPISVGNMRLGKKYMEIAYRENPKLLTVLLAYADILMEFGKKRKALAILNGAKKIKPDTWFEAVELDVFKPGIDILKGWIESGSWDKVKDVFKAVEHQMCH